MDEYNFEIMTREQIERVPNVESVVEVEIFFQNDDTIQTVTVAPIDLSRAMLVPRHESKFLSYSMGNPTTVQVTRSSFMIKKAACFVIQFKPNSAEGFDPWAK